MALARTRASARRVKDRWKSKTGYRLVAPPMFNKHPLGETLADEVGKLEGRRVEIAMNEITGDLKQMHIKLTFQVADVHDVTCETTYVGHTMTSDYVRRLTRRGHTKIPLVFDVKCRDGSRVRIKPFAISDRRCQTTQAQAIRRVVQQMVEESANKHSLAGFLKDILIDDLTTRIYKEARKIHPLRRIEIAKAEILKAPAVEVDETPILVMATPEPEPTEEGEEEGEDAGEELSAAAESEEEDAGEEE